MKIGILEPEHFLDINIKLLEKNIGQVFLFNNKNTLDEFIKDKDIIFIRLKYNLNKNILKHAKKLKTICSPTTGLNHLDLKYLKTKGIDLISLRGKTKFLNQIRATPENTIGLSLALLRKYNIFFSDTINKNNRYNYLGDELFGIKAGIIGFGRVGKLLSRYLKAFGSIINVYDIKKVKQINGILVKENLNELINCSDIIYLTASFNGKKILKRKHLDLMKNKYLINTSRGELIDEKYLLEKASSNHFKGVAIDVISNENNLFENNLSEIEKLRIHSNFIYTPHISGATLNSLTKVETYITNELIKKHFV